MAPRLCSTIRFVSTYCPDEFGVVRPITGPFGMLRTTPHSSGQYVLTGVPKTNSLQLSLQVETGVASTNINTIVTGQADLFLSNLPPVINSLNAIWDGQVTNRVAPGATVQLTVDATDPGDTLQYRWFPWLGADSLIDTNSPTNS